MRQKTDTFGVYFYSPYSKLYEWSLISGDLSHCRARFNEKPYLKALILKQKTVYPKPNMSREEIIKNYQIIQERDKIK